MTNTLDNNFSYSKTTPHFVLLFGIKMVLVCLLSIPVTKSVSAQTKNSDNLTVRDIIEKMESTYSGSRTYSDSGEVKIIISGEVNQTVEKPFTTAFIRPDQFRFEFREKEKILPGQIFIIYRKGNYLRTYWNINKDIKPESLDRAIASATGISGGSAITVPAMLLPDEITWRRAIRFNKPVRIGDDVIDNIDCFRIYDTIMGNSVTLWIDKELFLLRKIYREQEFEDFSTRETTDYKPVLNEKVSDEMLSFSPPADKPWWKFW